MDGIEGASVAFATGMSVVERLAVFDQTPMATAMSPAAASAINVRMEFSNPGKVLTYCDVLLLSSKKQGSDAGTKVLGQTSYQVSGAGRDLPFIAVTRETRAANLPVASAADNSYSARK